MAQSPVVQRSTKGASKQRRDLINGEIERLKDLLPLSETIRQRLFQLQVMSLVCIYIRKERYLPHVLSHQYYPCMFLADEDFDICKTLRGFLLMVTRQGKLLYISENASDFLGHSVEEIMSQGDSLYDLVDPRDHGTVQAELLSGPPSISINMTFPDERIFMCRMNLNRAARRHLQYHKFIIVHGRYLHPAEYYQTLLTFTGPGGAIHPVFAAFCTPLITPENTENLSMGNTTVFSSLHNMDMKFIQLDDIGIYHLGYSSEDLTGTSWYRLVHPNDLPEASFKHKLLCEDKETCCVLLIRLQAFSGHYLWLHTVLALKEGVRNENVEQLILATYQKLSDIEAATLQANCWIYSAPHRLQDQQFSVLNSRPSDLPYLIPCRGGSMVSSAPSTPMAPLIPEPLSAASPSLPTKPKRKYSKAKSKPAQQMIDTNPMGQNADEYRRVVEPVVVSSNGSRKAAGVHGLSPPTSDSPLADGEQITVEIPFSHHLPPYFNLPSMLTPETSPANSTGSSSGGGSHGSTAGGVYIIHQSIHKQPKMSNYHRPGTTQTTRMNVMKSPLPVIEPQALEAYLSRVESEGCMPVFRSSTENPHQQVYDAESAVPSASLTCGDTTQSLRQLLDAPAPIEPRLQPDIVGSTYNVGCAMNDGCPINDHHHHHHHHQHDPATTDFTSNTFPPITSGHWHRSFSWSPSTPFDDLTVFCENPFVHAPPPPPLQSAVQSASANNGDSGQSVPPQSNIRIRPTDLYPADQTNGSHMFIPDTIQAPVTIQTPASSTVTQNRSGKIGTSNSNRITHQNCRHGSLSK